MVLHSYNPAIPTNRFSFPHPSPTLASEPRCQNTSDIISSLPDTLRPLPASTALLPLMATVSPYQDSQPIGEPYRHPNTDNLIFFTSAAQIQSDLLRCAGRVEPLVRQSFQMEPYTLILCKTMYDPPILTVDQLGLTFRHHILIRNSISQVIYILLFFFNPEIPLHHNQNQALRLCRTRTHLNLLHSPREAKNEQP